MSDLIETAYDHVSGSDTFTVTAAERWSIAMIKRLAQKHPDQVKIIHINKDGSMLAHVPLEWMRISPKRKVTVTDEQRKASSDRMKALHEKSTLRTEITA